MTTTGEGIEDAAILERIVQRDPEGIALLYDRHARVAFALAYRIVGECGAAEEIVEEVFLTIWRRTRSYDVKHGSVRAWLLASIHHRAVDFLRHQRSTQRAGVEETWAEVAATVERGADRSDRRDASARATGSGDPHPGLSRPPIADATIRDDAGTILLYFDKE